MRSTFETPILAFLMEHAGRLMSRYQVGRDGRTAYELHAGKPYRRQLVEFGERVYFMPIRPGGARQAKLDPKWQDGAFIGIRDRSDWMLIMTTSGVYKTRNVRRRPESERWDFEFLMTLKGTPWNPNPAAGEMAADALPADTAVPMPAPAPVPQIVVAAATVDRAASRVYIKKADVQKYGYIMNCLGCRSVMTNTTARAHTEECRKRIESCLAKDEETKFRSEAAKLRVDNWLASRVESTEKPRSGDAVSHEPSGAASSSAPAAAASGSVPMAVSSSSAAERFRCDEVPDHGVKRVRWSPHEQDTNESSVQIASAVGAFFFSFVVGAFFFFFCCWGFLFFFLFGLLFFCCLGLLSFFLLLFGLAFFFFCCLCLLFFFLLFVLVFFFCCLGLLSFFFAVWAFLLLSFAVW